MSAYVAVAIVVASIVAFWATGASRPPSPLPGGGRGTSEPAAAATSRRPAELARRDATVATSAPMPQCHEVFKVKGTNTPIWRVTSQFMSSLAGRGRALSATIDSRGLLLGLPRVGCHNPIVAGPACLRRAGLVAVPAVRTSIVRSSDRPRDAPRRGHLLRTCPQRRWSRWIANRSSVDLWSATGRASSLRRAPRSRFEMCTPEAVADPGFVAAGLLHGGGGFLHRAGWQDVQALFPPIG